MIPPVTFNDRSDYKRRMNELLTIDPQKTVVLTVDMQREYLDMEVGTSPVLPAEAERVIRHARELLDFARSEGIPVIHAYVSRRAHPAEAATSISATLDVGRGQGLSQNLQVSAVRKVPNRIEGTPQAEVPAVLVEPGDVHMTAKRVMDAFHQTDLDMLLGRVFKPETVVLTGINTDTCVYATTMAASHRGYKPVVISDCVASMRGLDSHWMALELMSRSIAWVLTVEELKAKVREARGQGAPTAAQAVATPA